MISKSYKDLIAFNNKSLTTLSKEAIVSDYPDLTFDFKEKTFGRSWKVKNDLYETVRIKASILWYNNIYIGLTFKNNGLILISFGDPNHSHVWTNEIYDDYFNIKNELIEKLGKPDSFTDQGDLDSLKNVKGAHSKWIFNDFTLALTCSMHSGFTNIEVSF